MSGKTYIDPSLYMAAAGSLAEKIDREHQSLSEHRQFKIYGIPRGGIPAAMAVCAHIPASFRVVSSPEEADILIDDIYDSGRTYNRYRGRFPDKPFYAIFDKREPGWKDHWLTMPYEVSDMGTDESANDIVVRLLQYIGENPLREGLKDTPKRFLKAWKEWAAGYSQNPEDHVKTFADGAEGVDEMVIVHNIPVVSKCEHHLADITGVAHIGYIPNGKVLGLSKLARIFDCYARRLQVQERLTNQVADFLNKSLEPKGVGVLVRAAHGCMSSRGVKIHGSLTTTSAMRGVLLNKPEARAEFISLCETAERQKSY